MKLDAETKQYIRRLLSDLQLFMLEAIRQERDSKAIDELAAVFEETAADTIYAIDKVAERAIEHWFAYNWPIELPIEIGM